MGLRQCINVGHDDVKKQTDSDCARNFFAEVTKGSPPSTHPTIKVSKLCTLASTPDSTGLLGRAAWCSTKGWDLYTGEWAVPEWKTQQSSVDLSERDAPREREDPKVSTMGQHVKVNIHATVVTCNEHVTAPAWSGAFGKSPKSGYPSCNKQEVILVCSDKTPV